MDKKVIADPILREKLAAANGHPVELCDEAGRLLGYALTPDQHHRLLFEWVKAQHTDEELDRMYEAAQPGPYTMDDVLRLFGVTR